MEKRTKMIVFYSEKGGSGKTTTTANVAAAMATLGKRVMIVDCDNQRNITHQLKKEVLPPHSETGSQRSRLPEDEPEAKDPPMIEQDPLNPQACWYPIETFIQEVQDKTIVSCLRKWFNHEEDWEEDIKEAVIKVNEDSFPDGNFLLMKGSNKWNTVRSEIATPVNTIEVPSQQQNSIRPVTIFKDLMDKLAKSYDLDFIMVDVGPSTDEVNKMIVMSSDYICPPVFADSYSTTAVHALLTNFLPAWLSWREIVMKVLPAGKRTPEPRVLPILLNNYTTEDHKMDITATNFFLTIEDFCNRYRADQGSYHTCNGAPHVKFSSYNGQLVLRLLPHMELCNGAVHELGRTFCELKSAEHLLSEYYRIDMNHLDGMSQHELRQLCKKFGLSSNAPKKDVLVKRLKDFGNSGGYAGNGALSAIQEEANFAASRYIQLAEWLISLNPPTARSGIENSAEEEIPPKLEGATNSVVSSSCSSSSSGLSSTSSLPSSSPCPQLASSGTTRTRATGPVYLDANQRKSKKPKTEVDLTHGQ